MTNDSHEGRQVVIGNMAQRSLTKFTEEGNDNRRTSLKGDHIKQVQPMNNLLNVDHTHFKRGEELRSSIRSSRSERLNADSPPFQVELRSSIRGSKPERRSLEETHLHRRELRSSIRTARSERKALSLSIPTDYNRVTYSK